MSAWPRGSRGRCDRRAVAFAAADVGVAISASASGSIRVTSTTPHLQAFEGGNAVSGFRRLALLPRLQAVSERIVALQARYVHWV